MELALLAFAAIGVMISIWGKYSYERAGGRLRDYAIDSPAGAPRIVGMPPHDVVVDRARSELAPPQSPRRHRPMREKD